MKKKDSQNSFDIESNSDKQNSRKDDVDSIK